MSNIMDATIATIAREPLTYTASGAVRPASLNRETYASLMGVILAMAKGLNKFDFCKTIAIQTNQGPDTYLLSSDLHLCNIAQNNHCFFPFLMLVLI